MSVDRIATSQQSAYMLSQINAAGAKLDNVNKQIASGVVADTYAGFGDKAQVLQATLSAQARNNSYTTATDLARPALWRVCCQSRVPSPANFATVKSVKK